MEFTFEETLVQLKIILQNAVEQASTCNGDEDWRRSLERFLETAVPELKKLEQETFDICRPGLDPDRLPLWRVKVMASLLVRVLSPNSKEQCLPPLCLDQVLLLAARLHWSHPLSSAVLLLKAGWTRQLLMHGLIDLILGYHDNTGHHDSSLELLSVALDVGMATILETQSGGGPQEQDGRLRRDAAACLVLTLLLLASRLCSCRVETQEAAARVAPLFLQALVLWSVYRSASALRTGAESERSTVVLDPVQFPVASEFLQTVDSLGPGVVWTPVWRLCRLLSSALAVSGCAVVSGQIWTHLQTLQSRFSCLEPLLPAVLTQDLLAGITLAPASVARERLGEVKAHCIVGEREVYFRPAPGWRQVEADSGGAGDAGRSLPVVGEGDGDTETRRSHTGKVEEVSLLQLLSLSCYGDGDGTSDVPAEILSSLSADASPEHGEGGSRGDTELIAQLVELLEALADAGQADRVAVAETDAEPEWVLVLLEMVPPFHGVLKALLECGLNCVREEVKTGQQDRARRVLALRREMGNPQSGEKRQQLQQQMAEEAMELCMELLAWLPQCMLDSLLGEGVMEGWLPPTTTPGLPWHLLASTFNRLTPDLPHQMLVAVAECLLMDTQAVLQYAIRAALRNADQQKMMVKVLRQFPALCRTCQQGQELPVLGQAVAAVMSSDTCLNEEEEHLLSTLLLHLSQAYEVGTQTRSYLEPGVLSPLLAACLVLGLTCPEDWEWRLGEAQQKPVSMATAIKVLRKLVKVGGSCSQGEWGGLWGGLGPPAILALGRLLGKTWSLRDCPHPQHRANLRSQVQRLLQDLSSSVGAASVHGSRSLGHSVTLSGLAWRERWQVSTVLQAWGLSSPGCSTLERLQEPLGGQGLLATVLQAASLTGCHAELLPLLEHAQFSREATVLVLARILMDSTGGEVERLLQFLVRLTLLQPSLLPAASPAFPLCKHEGCLSGELEAVVQVASLLRDTMVVLAETTVASMTVETDRHLCHLSYVMRTCTTALKAVMDSACEAAPPTQQLAVSVELCLLMSAVRCQAASFPQLTLTLDTFIQHLLQEVKAVVHGNAVEHSSMPSQWAACFPTVHLALQVAQVGPDTRNLLQQLTT